MTNEPTRSPSRAESAMAANARSRDRQGRRADRARHDPQAMMMEDGAQEQSYGQMEEPSLQGDRAFDAAAEQRAGDEGMAPSIQASKARSAELLREATDLLASRTNDS